MKKQIYISPNITLVGLDDTVRVLTTTPPTGTEGTPGQSPRPNGSSTEDQKQSSYHSDNFVHNQIAW